MKDAKNKMNKNIVVYSKKSNKLPLLNAESHKKEADRISQIWIKAIKNLSDIKMKEFTQIMSKDGPPDVQNILQMINQKG